MPSPVREGDREGNLLTLLDLDLREGYPDIETSVTLSVLRLQFIPIEHQLRLVQDVHDHTIENGAFLIVEKLRGSSTRTDAVMTTLYHDQKA